MPNSSTTRPRRMHWKVRSKFNLRLIYIINKHEKRKKSKYSSLNREEKQPADRLDYVSLLFSPRCGTSKTLSKTAIMKNSTIKSYRTRLEPRPSYYAFSSSRAPKSHTDVFIGLVIHSNGMFPLDGNIFHPLSRKLKTNTAVYANPYNYSMLMITVKIITPLKCTLLLLTY